MSIVLPDKGTDIGAVARVVLVEARNPGSKKYSADESLKSMQWMQLVLINRLHNNPVQFAAAGAKSLRAIIKAHRQFAGFEQYPNYDHELVEKLTTILKIANTTKDPRTTAYQVFVKNGLSVAKSPPIADPAKVANAESIGLVGWRTENCGAPGPNFSLFQSIAGNSFFTLKKPTPSRHHPTRHHHR